MSTRDELIGLMEDYLEALARTTRRASGLGRRPVTENGQQLELGKGLWATATSVPDHDYLHRRGFEHRPDRLARGDRRGREPALGRVRAAEGVRDGLVHEIETVVRRAAAAPLQPGEHAQPRAIAFEVLGAGGALVGRDVLVEAANRYFDGLEQAKGDDHPRDRRLHPVRERDADRARRGREHLAGRQRDVFPLGVREQVDSGYFSYMDDVRDRRVVAVDEARGLVMLVVVFDHSARKRTVEVKGVGEVELPAYHQVPNSVLIAEVFKVRNGLIEHIEAVLEFVPYGMRTGWEVPR